MIILSHRGYWKEKAEQNTQFAFERSFDLGFGVEIDVRDSQGNLVIAHDMPQGGELLFEEVLQSMDSRNLYLAINIKADGLYHDIQSILHKYQHTQYFCFDMSIPDMMSYVRHGVRVFTGYSDIMREPVLMEESCGVWLDSFMSDWYDHSVIDTLIEQGKKCCIVSSELHGRLHHEQWKQVKKSKYLREDRLLLCTDYPEEAKEYFYGKD